MPRKKLPYKEGDWFAVPLKQGGYALGLAARVTSGGGILGYFFAPRHDTIPVVEDTQGLRADDAIFIGKFGDLGLLNDEWPIVYKPTECERTPWPMPAFGRVDGMEPSVAFRTVYNENSINEALREDRVAPEVAKALPEDGVFGYVALELWVGRLLK